MFEKFFFLDSKLTDFRGGFSESLKFFFTVSLIQLCKFFRCIDKKCGNTNYYFILFAFIVLCLEPIIAVFIAYKFNITSIDNDFLKFIVILYLFVFGFAIMKAFCFPDKLCSKASLGNNHLNWDIYLIFNSLPKILLYMFAILYFQDF